MCRRSIKALKKQLDLAKKTSKKDDQALKKQLDQAKKTSKKDDQALKKQLDQAKKTSKKGVEALKKFKLLPKGIFRMEMGSSLKLKEYNVKKDGTIVKTTRSGGFLPSTS